MDKSPVFSLVLLYYSAAYKLLIYTTASASSIYYTLQHAPETLELLFIAIKMKKVQLGENLVQSRSVKISIINTVGRESYRDVVP